MRILAYLKLEDIKNGGIELSSSERKKLEAKSAYNMGTKTTERQGRLPENFSKQY